MGRGYHHPGPGPGGCNGSQGPIEGGACLHVVLRGKYRITGTWVSGQRGLTFQQGKHYTVSAFLKCKKGTCQDQFQTRTGTDSVDVGRGAVLHHDGRVGGIPFYDRRSLSTLSPCEVVFHVGYAASDFWIDAVQFYEGDYVPTVLKRS